MAYTGSWKRAQRNADLSRNPNLGDQVDDAHLNPVEFSDPFHEPTPNLPTLPEYMYAADDFMLPIYLPNDEPYIREPLGHNVGGADRRDQDGRLSGADVYAYRAHMEDRGAAAVHHAAERIERADADTYVTQRVEMELPSTGSRAALTRGRNSWPENNPDGPPPQGHYTMRWIDRQFSRRQARHDMAPLRPYVAGNAVDIPAPSHGNANQYTSPYGVLANARALKLSTPQIRRVPRPADENATTDGTEDAQYSAPVYWQGW